MTVLGRRGLFAWVVMCGLVVGPVGVERAAKAQASTATDAVVRGAVVDASGAQVAHARVHAEGREPTTEAEGSAAGAGAVPGASAEKPRGAVRDVETDATGHFLLALPPGVYNITVQAGGFDPYVREGLKLDASQHAELAVKLLVAAQTEVVNVAADAGAATDPSQNRDAIVFKGAQLQTFSDDDTILQQQLTALAGGDPSLPPQVLVDGFSNGKFPPKASIREIRINQNPFSAQYDQTGYGRVEVFTKPGSDTFHGDVSVNFNNKALNTRNPFVTGDQPDYHRENLNADFNGPLGKKTSFFLGASLNDNEDNSPINATVVDAGLNQVGISGVLASPSFQQNYSLRLDRQLGANDTALVRYSFSHNTQTNGGIGTLTLASQALNSSGTTEQLQAGDTHVIGTKVVLESRFQYNRTRSLQDPVSSAPTLIVQGAFSGGGNPALALHDHQDRYEFQEYTSIALKTHFIRMGGRYRLLRDTNLSTAGYNGQYIFPDIATYTRALNDVRTLLTDPVTKLVTLPTADQPSQFNITVGQPRAAVLTGDAGLYAEDDWKVRPDVTFSYGGRIETQSAIPDHLDLAPRVAAAWAPVFGKRKTPAFTLRSGFGMFYDRFDSGSLLQTIRQNGRTEQGYYVESPPQFGCAEGQAAVAACTPVLPPAANLTAMLPSIYRLSPNLRSEYTMQGAIIVERSLGEKGNISTNWVRNRGVHFFDERNINAPLPGTYLPGVANSGTRPLGGTQNIYQYSSDGVRNVDVLRINANYQPTRNVYFWSSYAVQSRAGDTSGAGNLPSNQYNVKQDYGPLPGTSAEQFYGGGGGQLGRGFVANVFIATRSRLRYNITTGQDLNGDTAYNDRPTFATDMTRASVVRTALGNFDTSPIAGQTLIPFDYAEGPRLLYTELFVGKNFFFGTPTAAARTEAAAAPVVKGKPAKKPDQPYHLLLSAEIDNALNHTNPGTPVGTLSSPYFGKSLTSNNNFGTGGAANRTVALRLGFEF